MADLSKLNGYAVIGGSDEAVTVSKAIAYAVTDSNVSFASVGKLVAYAVVIDAATTARPVVFVAT